VLLGWRDGDDRIITGLLGPGPASLHGRFAFVPDHAWQLRRIREAFSSTSGDLDYLGDWHTHPDGVPEMSSRDHQTLHRIARRVRRPVMLIAAGGPSKWEIGGWIADRRGVLRRKSDHRPHEVRSFALPTKWPSYIILN